MSVSVEQVTPRHIDTLTFLVRVFEKKETINLIKSCTIDLHEFLTGPMIIPATAHPLTGEKIPVTLGHEISATVVEVGSDVNRDDVEHLNPGDKVAVFPLLADNSCPSCLRGRPNCCASFGSIGFSGTPQFFSV